jgi:hypothetical protein
VQDIYCLYFCYFNKKNCLILIIKIIRTFCLTNCFDFTNFTIIHMNYLFVCFAVLFLAFFHSLCYGSISICNIGSKQLFLLVFIFKNGCNTFPLSLSLVLEFVHCHAKEEISKKKKNKFLLLSFLN